MSATTTAAAGGAATTATTSSSAASTSATSTGATSTTASSSATTGSGGPVYGYCAKACVAPSDCCPASAPAGSCPSDKYPNNYVCDKGACPSPQCASQADCATTFDNGDCLVLSGVSTCEEACSAAHACTTPNTTCTGVDDNGKKYCLPPAAAGCGGDAACFGFGKCVNKVCVCASSADCTAVGYTACAL